VAEVPGRRVGELFLLGFRGLTVPAWLAGFERAFGLGGAILFDVDVASRTPGRNVRSPDQLKALCAELHALPSRPLVFVDQEGGRVRRLKPACGFVDLPAARDFARLPEAARRELATRACAEMAALGIDVDLAPVVDLASNPANPNIAALGRSFSDDPGEVRRNVAIWCEAARGVGLGLCLKHFPGLGGATTDSHLELTDVTGTFGPEQLALFFDLWREVPGGAVLLSHGLVRDWDPAWPVSVSQGGVGALRRRAPDALLVTDDLQMQGLQRRCGTVEACLRAVRAGVDLLCICNNLLAQEAECVEAARRLEEEAARDAALAERIAAAQERVAARKRGSRERSASQ
jgi:beta-N-acetylhexosaminidase